MNSGAYPTSEKVLADLGDDFVHAFIEAVDGARDDFEALRKWQPGWFPSFTSRFTANLLHERIWARLVQAVDGMDGVHIKDREPVRELRSGSAYLIRIKRHHAGDRISTYGTQGALDFWTDGTLTFEGMESHSLALGYYWDAELREVRDAMVSFRDGKDNPVWAVTLQSDTAAARGFTWAEVEPSLPVIDVSGVLEEGEEETGS